MSSINSRSIKEEHISSTAHLMGLADKWGHSRGIFKRYALPRVTHIVTIPLQLVGLTFLTISSAYLAASLTAKLVVRTSSLILPKSQIIRRIDQKLRGPRTLITVVLTIAKLSLSIFYTAILGSLISPSFNYKIHQDLGFAPLQKKPVPKPITKTTQTKPTNLPLKKNNTEQPKPGQPEQKKK